jgi:hypothetical protein
MDDTRLKAQMIVEEVELHSWAFSLVDVV